jgi:MSHA pilin protein MshB
MKRNKQKGFTIIELVVVILLLGILTATALPRFMDVENQAHAAVVDAVRAGMVTSAGLFRAQWYAEGQPAYPAEVADYDDMVAYTTGYPLGEGSDTVDTSVMKSSENCLEIYENFIQLAGRPSIDTVASDAAALTAADITSSTTDFLAYVDTSTKTTSRQCRFVYTGQFTDAASAALPVLLYDAATGNVTEATAL